MDFVFHSMGIPVHITVCEENAKNNQLFFKEVEDIFRSWDMEFSRFLEDSALCKLNKHAGAWMNVSPRMFGVLKQCVEIARDTDGLFDPSVGGVLASYGYGLPENYMPPAIHSTWRDIHFKEKPYCVCTAEKQILEPAAIVKGMAIDNAGNVPNAPSAWMINAGGDILTKGSFKDQKYWNIAIQHPLNKEAIVSVVKLHNEAISTSGSYEVHGTSGGSEWNHQVNMQKIKSVNDLVSVSVIAPTSETADTYASVAFLYGLKKGIEFCEKKQIPYLFIAKNMGMYKNNLFTLREVSNISELRS